MHIRRVILALFTSLIATVAVAVPAQAEVFGPNWTVLTHIQDPCGKWNPMRSGKWDTVTQSGWGWYKMFFKHGISKWDVWETTVDRSCGKQEANTTTWIYHQGFSLVKCDSSGCETLDHTTVRSVVQRKLFNGERKGMITTYCTDRDPCPNWLNNYTRGARQVAPDGTDVITRTPTPEEIANDVVGDDREFVD